MKSSVEMSGSSILINHYRFVFLFCIYKRQTDFNNEYEKQYTFRYL